MEGWLEKEGHIFKTWKKRWCVLDKSSGTLCYFTDSSKTTKKGEYRIVADSALTSLDDGYAGRKSHLFAIQAEGTNNFLMLSASTEENKECWIFAIQECISNAREQIETLWST